MSSRWIEQKTPFACVLDLVQAIETLQSQGIRIQNMPEQLVELQASNNVCSPLLNDWNKKCKGWIPMRLTSQSRCWMQKMKHWSSTPSRWKRLEILLTSVYNESPRLSMNTVRRKAITSGASIQPTTLPALTSIRRKELVHSRNNMVATDTDIGVKTTQPPKICDGLTHFRQHTIELAALDALNSRKALLHDQVA